MTDSTLRPATGFVRLLGQLDFVERDTQMRPLDERQAFSWTRLPVTDDLDERVRLGADHERPEPLAFSVLFDPDPDGIYDIEWLVAAGAHVARGEALVRGYRVTDGLPISQAAQFDLDVRELLVKRNDRAVKGDAILIALVPSLALAPDLGAGSARDRLLELAQAVNAAFKGLLASDGQGGAIAKEVIGVERRLEPDAGIAPLREQIADALAGTGVQDGDVIVVSESVVAVAQGRLFPLEVLYRLDPKVTDAEGRHDALDAIREHLDDIEFDDLILADSLTDRDPPMATAGVRDPNAECVKLAAVIRDRLGVSVDVVISDTDTGLEVRETLIGAISIAATPIGATAGLVLYECMRVATAAEFCRGASRGIPIVVCRPHSRRAAREGIGETRGYPGRLRLERERLIGFA